MSKILEIQILPVPESDVTVPKGSTALSVALRKRSAQPDYVTALYFKGDPAAPVVRRHVSIRSAGMDLTGQEGRFLGSVTMYPTDDVVLHVYVRDET